MKALNAVTPSLVSLALVFLAVVSPQLKAGDTVRDSPGESQPIIFRDLVLSADTIFAGKVDSRFIHELTKGPAIYHSVEFREVSRRVAESAVNGPPEQDVVLHFASTSADPSSLPACRFLPGDSYLIFAYSDGNVYSDSVVAGIRGVFRIIEDSVTGIQYPLAPGGSGIAEIVDGVIRETSVVEDIEDGTISWRPLAVTMAPSPINHQTGSAGLTKEPLRPHHILDLDDLWHEIEKIQDAAATTLPGEILPDQSSLSDTQTSNAVHRPLAIGALDDLSLQISSTEPLACADFPQNATTDNAFWPDLCVTARWPVDETHNAIEQPPLGPDILALNQSGIDTWNRYMDVFRAVPGDSTGGVNGQSEFVGFPSDQWMEDTYGFWFKWDGWGDGTAATFPRAQTRLNGGFWLYETDVAFNPGHNWTPKNYLQALLHELGHAWGLNIFLCPEETYRFDYLTVMHEEYQPWVILEDGYGIHAADAHSIRLAYGGLIPVPPIKDVGVESYYAARTLFPASIDPSEVGTVLRKGQILNINGMTVENMSSSATAGVGLAFRLSEDRNIDASDFQLSSWGWSSVPAESFWTGLLTQTIPITAPTGRFYLGANVTTDNNLEGTDDYPPNNATLVLDYPVVICPADTNEPDDLPVLATELTPDGVISQAICPASDRDYVTFELEAPSGVTLYTEALGLNLELRDGQLGFLDEAVVQCGRGGCALMIDRVCGVNDLAAGTYYLSVAVDGATDIIDEYTLDLRSHPCDAQLIAVTQAASDIEDTSAVLNAAVNPDGSETVVGFSYGTSAGYGSYVHADTLPGLQQMLPVEVEATGLNCDTTYHFQVNAYNATEEVFGEDSSFKTLSCSQLPNDVDTRLLLHFNSDLQGVDGETPISPSELSFEPGVIGESVYVPSPGGFLVYHQEANISAAEGTVEFWFKPSWSGSQDSVTRYFFNAGLPFDNGMDLSIDGANNLRFIQWGDDPVTSAPETDVERGLAASGEDLQEGRWYHLAATWKTGERMSLYRDGRVVASRSDGVAIEDFWGAVVHLGSNSSGLSQAEAAFDEFRISTRQRSDEEIWEDFSSGLVDNPNPDLIFRDDFEFYDYWPNPSSKANSDPWLVQHHDQIRVMRPRVLVLNFMNDFDQEVAMTERLIEGLRQSTTYHGYSDPEATPFLEYEVARYVDLSDEPGTVTPDGNSTRYPRVPDWSSGNNFAYEKLYTEEFAEYFGFEDPQHPGTYLNLRQLLEMGIIHEVWFFAYQRDYGAPYESVEIKQYYDQELNPIPGAYGGAGNGHYPGLPWTGRSLRFTFINGQRGIGCAIENLGHALEGMAHYNFSPYWRNYFYEFAGFDLDERWGLPFSSFYGGVTNDYPAPDRLEWSWNGQSGAVDDYYVVGGNVHFMPAGQKDYDLDNTQQVYSTIEHYRLFDGPGGTDTKELWDRSKFTPYQSVAPDCQGSWLVYWRMNMPGLTNEAIDINGQPMKNWWVFLFY